MFSLRGRLAQVVYTLTQFATVDRVNFKLEGKPVKVFSSEEDRPEQARHPGDVPRPLPAPDLRRSAGVGCRPLYPSRVTGLANVPEAQFRIALLDGNDKMLVDVR